VSGEARIEATAFPDSCHTQIVAIIVIAGEPDRKSMATDGGTQSDSIASQTPNRQRLGKHADTSGRFGFLKWEGVIHPYQSSGCRDDTDSVQRSLTAA